MIVRILALSLCFWSGIASCQAAAEENAGDDPAWGKVLELIESAPAAVEEFEREHGRYATVNGIRLHYLEWPGPSPDSPVLIWMNGGFSSAYELVGFAPYLTGAGYRVISVDVRGHGRTKIADFDFTIYDCADDIVQLMDHLSIDTAVIGGFSMGGYIAAALYHDFPDRAEALILEEGGHLTIQKAWDVLAVIKKDVGEEESLFKGEEGATDSSREFDTLQKYLEGSVRPLFEAGAEITMDYLLVYASLVEKKDDGRWGLAADGDRVFGPLGENTCMSAHQKPFTVSLRYFLPKAVFRTLTVPILLIEGNDPLRLSREEVEKYGFNDLGEGPWLEQRYPTLVRRVVYDGAGHNVKFYRPDEFLRDVLGFLGDLERR